MDSDGDGPVDDAVDVASLDPTAYGIFSHTNTHYAFGDGPHPGAGFQLDHQQEDARTEEQADRPPEGIDLPLAALGLGEGVDLELIDSDSILAGGGGASQSDAGGHSLEKNSEPDPGSQDELLSHLARRQLSPLWPASLPREPPKTTGMTVPVRAQREPHPGRQQSVKRVCGESSSSGAQDELRQR